MKVILEQSSLINDQSIRVAGSKSQTNRLLLLQKIFSNIDLQNISNSDDSVMMQGALESTATVIDIHHAGTAMRFLTAYFAIQPHREVILTGSTRMKERPIKILVDALNQLGADIEYMDKEGFPPLRIKGRKLQKNQISLPANISSQYISALLLVAPQLEQGIELIFEGTITSKPYIEMTLALLTELGVENKFYNNKVKVSHQPQIKPTTITIESDWSSASYFYSMIALSSIGTELTLSKYHKKSLQGDSKLVDYFKHFGVETVFTKQEITLVKLKETEPYLEVDLIDTPDLAQTLAVTCFGLGIACNLTGLQTLKIKETDRLIALQTELQKLGANVKVTNDSLHLDAVFQIKSGVEIDTYQDHRMAMAFAPLALKTELVINDAMVVSKSFVDFWENLQSLGFHATKVDINAT